MATIYDFITMFLGNKKHMTNEMYKYTHLKSPNIQTFSIHIKKTINLSVFLKNF